MTRDLVQEVGLIRVHRRIEPCLLLVDEWIHRELVPEDGVHSQISLHHYLFAASLGHLTGAPDDRGLSRLILLKLADRDIRPRCLPLLVLVWI